MTLLLCLIMMIILHNQMARFRIEREFIDQREIYCSVPILIRPMKWKNSLLISNKQKENRGLEKTDKNKSFLHTQKKECCP